MKILRYNNNYNNNLINPYQLNQSQQISKNRLLNNDESNINIGKSMKFLHTPGSLKPKEVGLSITYQNVLSSRDINNSPYKAKQDYKNILDQQINLNNVLKKTKEEINRERLLDELRLAKENSTIELPKILEKKKVEEKIHRNDNENSKNINKAFLESVQELENFSPATKKTAEDIRKELLNKNRKNNYFYFYDNLTFDENIEHSLQKMQCLDSQLFCSNYSSK